MTFLIFNLNSIPVTIYFNAYIANEFLQCLLFWSNMHWSGLTCYTSGRCLLKVGDFLLKRSIDCLYKFKASLKNSRKLTSKDEVLSLIKTPCPTF